MNRLLLPASITLLGCDDAVRDDTAAPASDPSADAVVSFLPGAGAGFGQDRLPDVVLGAPWGGGDSGSLDVLSLGDRGSIVLELQDVVLSDGPGPDLLVFENAFVGWIETGIVAVSDDGDTWSEWPCDGDDPEGVFAGCAGVARVWSTPDNGIDPTNPAEAGGDAFDLADLGVARARFVRIVDSGHNTYDGETGGFDLDAIAVVNNHGMEE